MQRSCRRCSSTPRPRHRGVALRARDGDRWAETSVADVGVAALEIAAGLIALGVCAGDRVATLGETRPEWTLTDSGALCAGAVVVPVYQTSSREECQYVLAHSGARVVICENEDQFAKRESIRAALPALEHGVTIDAVAGAMSLLDLRAHGAGTSEASVRAAMATIDPDDVATIVYTSGTTGPPKGCELTHANRLVTARMYESRLELGPGVVIFMFLALAHALARH